LKFDITYLGAVDADQQIISCCESMNTKYPLIKLHSGNWDSQFSLH